MPFEKGKSGNDGKKFTKDNQPAPGTNGRKPKLPELDILLAKVLGEEKNGFTGAELMLKALHIQALKGNHRAAEILLNRGYGKQAEKVDMTTGGEKLNIAPQIVVYAGIAPPLAAAENDIEDDKEE